MEPVPFTQVVVHNPRDMITTDHEALIKCNPDAIIWRYMDLEKFELLLKNKSLFLCRSDKFSDPFEASIPKEESKHRIQEEIKNAKSLNQPTNPEEAKKKSDNIADLHKRVRRAFVVNCWHINSSESDAMWRLYLKTNEGVAIQSSYKKLIDSLYKNKEEIFISKVRYINYAKDIWYHETDYPVTRYNLFTPIIHKRTAFSHENEVRVFQQIDSAVDNPNYWDVKPQWWTKFIPFSKFQPKSIIGKNVYCDINKLIEKVILPPTSDNYVLEKVKGLLTKYNFKAEITKSELNDKPIY